MLALSLSVIYFIVAITRANDENHHRTFRKLLQMTTMDMFMSTEIIVPTEIIVIDSDSDDDTLVDGDDDTSTEISVDLFEVCDDAGYDLDDITSASGSSDEEAGDILLAICTSLDCDITEVCLTDDAAAALAAGTLTECSCDILVCDPTCDFSFLGSSAYSWKVWLSFAWIVYVMLAV